MRNLALAFGPAISCERLGSRRGSIASVRRALDGSDLRSIPFGAGSERHVGLAAKLRQSLRLAKPAGRRGRRVMP